MKKLFTVIFCVGLAAPLFADGTNAPGAASAATPSSSLTDDKSRVSYALGMLNGHAWKAQDIDFNVDLYMQGIKDGLAGGITLMTPEQAQQALKVFKDDLTAKQQQKRVEMAAKNKTEGEAFLTTNKMTPGIKLISAVLPNGQSSELQYLVEKDGSGPIPSFGEKVKVNYRGTFLDGTEFDSSYKRGQPFPCQVGSGVIPGWSEALKKMPVGSKWKLFIPADLAYGERGNMGIPPNSVLIFEVELLEIEPPAAPAPAAPAAAPLTSDIIKVPSAEELKKGAKIEVIKPEDLQKAQAQQQTNK